MSYLDHITAFLFDENRRLSSKAAVVLFVILAILFVDNILGFSYSFSTEKRIEHVQKINEILKDTTIDSTTKTFAINLRKQIIERKNIISQSLSFFRSKSNTYKNPKKIIQIDTEKNNEVIKSSIRDEFWVNVSASGIYFFIAIIMIPLMLVADRKSSLLQRLGTGIATTISFILFAFFLVWCAGLIPQISSTTWAWNYVLNFFVQITILWILIYVGKKKQ